MELRICRGAFLCLGWPAYGGDYLHAKRTAWTEYARRECGSPKRGVLFCDAAGVEGGAGGVGAYRSAARADTVCGGLGERAGFGDGVSGDAEAARSIRHFGLCGRV